MAIEPIENEQEYQRALKRIEELWESSDAEDVATLGALAVLVEDYEDRTEPMPKSNPPDMLDFLMDQRGVSADEVGAAIGASAKEVEELVSGCRPFTLPWIESLSAFFSVPPTFFVRSQPPAQHSITAR